MGLRYAGLDRADLLMVHLLQEEVAKMPAAPALMLKGRRMAHERWRSAAISLDGLLDYDEEAWPASTATVLSIFGDTGAPGTVLGYHHVILER